MSQSSEESPADPALSEELPPFRGQVRPSSNLDLLLSLDEPEQLIRELEIRALNQRLGPRGPMWEIVADGCHKIVERLNRANAPRT